MAPRESQLHGVQAGCSNPGRHCKLKRPLGLGRSRRRRGSGTAVVKEDDAARPQGKESIINSQLFTEARGHSRLSSSPGPEEGPAAGGVLDVNTALQEVRKPAFMQDGPAPGIRKSCQSLRQGQAHLCVFASNCDEPVYVQLVEALCAEHQINLIKVDDNKKRGERGALCRTDRGVPPGKVLACSCVIVKDDGKESQAKDVMEEYFKCKKRTN
ncbi:LOW QUALITY PROTEIN: 40S ribosomal protein S12-like [Ursus americanus]|uniref:LOW QUALITY PROTEIN: 40S ribosomal protein S12-like n=1 Tax=Ursus americanus TaxID=9643 RepID=UPI001E67933C|nr:LOW QUALITY PROTEIN: 40S ribosomal protein S12-like [Ursus americanus]